MSYKIDIYKDNKFYKKADFREKGDKLLIYKWENVDKGSYFFEIKDENDETYGVTYSHTAPFAETFEAIVKKSVPSKPITGFQKGVDILIIFVPEEKKFILKKMKFYKMNLNIAEFGLSEAKNIKIATNYDGWRLEDDPIRQLDKTNYEVILAIPEGSYEYKYEIDGKWYPEGANRKLIIGENGDLFAKGDLGTGKFVYEAIDKNVNLKAIAHNYKSLQYFNKISDREYEFKLRTQMNDVERVYISIVLHEEDNYEMIYELERFRDRTNGFDYFERMIDFGKKVDKIRYYFILEDGGVKAYFNGKILDYKVPPKIVIDTKSDDIQIFSIPDWAKEVIWYNIFPDRFYNKNHYNDPDFNQFGAEIYRKDERYDFTNKTL